jgi:hypothetical protein
MKMNSRNVIPLNCEYANYLSPTVHRPRLQVRPPLSPTSPLGSTFPLQSLSPLPPPPDVNPHSLHPTQHNTHHATMPPSQNSTYSGLTAFLIATFCLLALFPSAFVSIIWLPYNSLTGYYFPAAVQRYNVQCVAPNICVANSDTMSWSVLSLPIPSSFSLKPKLCAQLDTNCQPPGSKNP